MSTWEWLGFGLLLGLVVAVLVAFFLYLRTSYRRGGWRDVKTSFIIAIIALVLFCVVRLAENADLQTMKDAVNRITR
jgi:high-affinity Fe2+/Pb2+ permease